MGMYWYQLKAHRECGQMKEDIGEGKNYHLLEALLLSSIIFTFDSGPSRSKHHLQRAYLDQGNKTVSGERSPFL